MSLCDRVNLFAISTNQRPCMNLLIEDKSYLGNGYAAASIAFPMSILIQTHSSYSIARHRFSNINPIQNARLIIQSSLYSVLLSHHRGSDLEPCPTWKVSNCVSQNSLFKIEVPNLANQSIVTCSLPLHPARHPYFLAGFCLLLSFVYNVGDCWRGATGKSRNGRAF